MSWLVRSRVTTSQDLRDGQVLVAPLLGRARILCARAVFDRIRDFDLPINWPETGSSDADLSDWVNQFRKARILVPAGTDEATAIRRAYAGAVKPAAIHGIETRIVRNPVAAHDVFGALDAADLPRIANEHFVLSTNLIALAINDEEVIALHPTGSLTHMTTLLWRIAHLFGGGCRVRDAMASLKTFDGFDEHQFLRAVDFLARKRLLWCDEESELRGGPRLRRIALGAARTRACSFPLEGPLAAGLPSL